MHGIEHDLMIITIICTNVSIFFKYTEVYHIHFIIYRNSTNNDDAVHAKEFELETDMYYSCVTSSDESNFYDIKNRQLPKLPSNTSYTKLGEAKRVENPRYNKSPSNRNSDVYMNMDGSKNEVTDDKSDSASYTYEELENFQ